MELSGLDQRELEVKRGGSRLFNKVGLGFNFRELRVRNLISDSFRTEVEENTISRG